MDHGWIFVPSIMRGCIHTVDKNSVSMLAHFSPQHLDQPLVHWLAAYSIVLWLWESCVLTAASYSLWWGTNVIVFRLRSDSSQVRHLTAASYTCVLHWLWVFYRNASSSSIFCVNGWHKKTPPPPFLLFTLLFSVNTLFCSFWTLITTFPQITLISMVTLIDTGIRVSSVGFCHVSTLAWPMKLSFFAWFLLLAQGVILKNEEAPKGVKLGENVCFYFTSERCTWVPCGCVPLGLCP